MHDIAMRIAQARETDDSDALSRLLAERIPQYDPLFVSFQVSEHVSFQNNMGTMIFAVTLHIQPNAADPIVLVLLTYKLGFAFANYKDKYCQFVEFTAQEAKELAQDLKRACPDLWVRFSHATDVHVED